MKLILCDISRIPIEADFESVLPKMEERARERILRFRRREDRYRAFARDVLLSWALQALFPGRRAALEKNEYGKPFVPQEAAPSEKKEFSISHSGDLVAIAYGTGRVGLDVERLERIKDVEKLLRFFSDEEKKRIIGAADSKREFIRVWTYREAFSKLVGVGLSLFEREPVHLNFDGPKTTYRNSFFYFWEWTYPDYQITLCLEKPDEEIETVHADPSLWKRMLAVF